MREGAGAPSSLFVAMFRRLLERASVPDHVHVLKVCLLERMARKTEALKDRRDVVDDHGSILCDDRLLLPYWPVVVTVVHMSERTRIEYRASPDLPLRVDIVDWVRRLYEVALRVQLCGVRDARAVRVMRMVQWLLLIWVRVDDRVMRVMFGPAGPPKEWWEDAVVLHDAWRTRRSVVSPATPTTHEVVIDAARWKSTTLMGLLATRFVMTCC